MRSRTASVAASGPVVSGWSARHWIIRRAARWKVSFGAKPGTKRRILVRSKIGAVADVAEHLAGPEPVGGHHGEELGRDMHQLRLDAQRVRDDGVDLIPGVDVLAGDVEDLADGPRVSEQTDEALGEVLGVGQRPQRRAVPVHGDLGSSRDPVHDGPPAGQGRVGVVVGVRGPDDRDRETLVGQGLLQRELRPPLGRGVLEHGVLRDGRGLADGRLLDRLRVDGARADVHVLLGPSGEDVHHPAHVVRVVGQEVDDRIEVLVADRREQGRVVGHVARQPGDALGHLPSRAVVAPVQHGDRHPTLHREAHAGRTDRARATDIENAERRAVVLHHSRILFRCGLGLVVRAGRRTSPRSRSRPPRSRCPRPVRPPRRAARRSRRTGAASWPRCTCAPW